MFSTVLHNIKSPTNVGIIVRTHVAFGGSEVVFLGYEKPWSFKKGSQAFSRKLEKLCKIVFLESEDEFFNWILDNSYTAVAVEISEKSIPIHNYKFPKSTALIFGRESTGLTDHFLNRCENVVRIPQFGVVGSLNISTAAAIAMYEVNRENSFEQSISGKKYSGEKYK